MPIVETCGVCGLDLHFVPGSKEGSGRYFHIFSSDKVGYYKFIHLPVPALEDPSLTDGSEVPREGFCCIGGERLGRKVGPRASVMPENLPSMKIGCFLL